MDFENTVVFESGLAKRGRRTVSTPEKKKTKHKCNICDEFFTTKGIVMQHKIKRHGESNGVRKTCHICKQRFHFNSSYLQHKCLKSHKKATVFFCEYCNKKFGNKSNLKIHSLKHNPELARFGCTECPKVFLYLSHYNEHKKTHTDEFKCKTCHIKLSNQVALSNHEKTKHSKILEYECSLCDYKAPSKPKLDQHNTSNRHQTNVETLNRQETASQMTSTDSCQTLSSIDSGISNSTDSAMSM